MIYLQPKCTQYAVLTAGIV